MDPITAAHAAETVHNVGGGGLSLFQAALDFLRAGGPLAVAVLTGAWAVKKDRETKEAGEKATIAAKASYDQMVALVAAQTAAMVKMESTIAALKDVIVAMERRR